MRRNKLFALALTSLAISAYAADGTYFKFSDLVKGESVEELMDPTVKLYWGAQPTPDFSEVARPDVYTRSSISLGPFGGSKRHCIEAFEKALAAMIEDARIRGYDAITNIRAMQDEKPSDDAEGFNCKPGYKTTEVPLVSSFAMTQAAKQRAAEAEEQSAKLPARSPASGAIFLPLEPILTSSEAKTILGSDIKVYWGIKAPEYSQRYGPDQYSEDADIGELGSDEACKQAVLKTLSSMVQDAKTKHYDSIVKIRSFLDGQFAPLPTDVECELNKKTASVSLQFSLTSK